MKNPVIIRRVVRPVILQALLLALISCFAAAATPDKDPVLEAMRAELERSKAQLKLDGVAAPYFLQYQVTDIDYRSAEAAFGAIRANSPTRTRLVRVVVRIGDYKQDSYSESSNRGVGALNILPMDDDILALRHSLWLTTDNAYKSATEAFAAKQAELKQFTVSSPVDDFAHALPLQSIEPLVRLQVDTEPFLKMLQDSTVGYRQDPLTESCESYLKFFAINRYLINSEGTVTRSGQTMYQIETDGSTQAADGMRLERSRSYLVAHVNELPTEQKFLADTRALQSSLKMLREAPLADEEYRGPVLFSADAASDVFAQLVGENILGRTPDVGKPARTKGAYATSYQSRVLPDFLSVEDDPSLASIQGQSLLGHYAVDDEGVPAQKVQVIVKGKLQNYLIGREPIHDFPASNGHGRARIGNPSGASLGNLIITSSDPMSAADLKKKLIEICQQRDLPYGYYVVTMGSRFSPRLLYKVWAKDGHEELVRGAVFGDLDTRSLRNDVIAAGNDLNVDNLMLNVPHSIVNPSILFDELEVKRADSNKDKLPEYPAPPLSDLK